jgi:glycosyltransferase involved in cell wall biosynthesis
MTNLLIRPAVYRDGAEELDAEGLENHLSCTLGNLVSFRLSTNHKDLIVTVWKNGTIVENSFTPLKKQRFFRTRIVKAFIGDPACRHYLKLGMADSIRTYLNSSNLFPDLVITSNSSLFGISLAIPTNNRITRSVNFEPIHYLNENSFSFRTPLVFFLKLWSSFLEVIFSLVLPISPNDLHNYRKYFFGRIGMVLPLQHLRVTSETNLKQIGEKIQIGFLGSTYSVKHNRDSFEFVVGKLAPSLTSLPVHFNIYGVKSPEVKVGRNVSIHGWIDSIEDVYSINDFFVVPYFGGTGQKSKLFEPLCRGKLLIADPRAFSGFDFNPGEHYLSAKTLEDFISAIQMLVDDESLAREIPARARNLASILFSKELSLEILKSSFRNL